MTVGAELALAWTVLYGPSAERRAEAAHALASLILDRDAPSRSMTDPAAAGGGELVPFPQPREKVTL